MNTSIAKKKKCVKCKNKTYGTQDSQAVSHPSTSRARPCLTSVIEREPVRSRCYGRRRLERRECVEFMDLSNCDTIVNDL